MRRVSLLVIMLYSAHLCGCSITSLPSGVKDSIGQTESAITSASSNISNAKSSVSDNFIRHSNTGYFGKQIIIQNEADFLPPIFSNQIQIDKQFFGLRSISSSITDLTRIPTVLDIANSDSSNDSCSDVRITQQDGNLIDLLNVIGARCDIAWSYRDGKLVLADTETRTWPVKGIPGDIQVQNQINNNSGVQSQSGASGSSAGQGGSGGATTGQSQSQGQQSAIQTTAFNLENSLWTNLENALKNQISKTGKLSVSPATSSLTVTDKPSVILRINKFMQDQNDKIKRNVIIEIQIMSVDVRATDNYGVNWSTVLTGDNTVFSINGQAVQQSATGGSSAFVPSPVFVPTNTTQAFTLGVTSGSLSGSQFIINALSTKSQGSLVTSTAVATMSNQPVPLQFIDQQAYLASVSTTQTAQVGSQTSLTPGQLTTGISLNILPVIEADNKVNLQLSINISALKQMSQYSTQGASIQLPNTLQRNFMQKVVIKSGDTFVVTGFDSDNQSIINTGVGSTSNWWLGGGVSADKVRTRMVMLVTPRVIN